MAMIGTTLDRTSLIRGSKMRNCNKLCSGSRNEGIRALIVLKYGKKTIMEVNGVVRTLRSLYLIGNKGQYMYSTCNWLCGAYQMRVYKHGRALRV